MALWGKDYEVQANQRAERYSYLCKKYPNIHVLPETPFLIHVHTTMRNHSISRSQFLFTAQQLIRTIIEYAFDQCLYTPKDVITPVGHTFHGSVLAREIVGVSIVRAGESMEQALSDIVQNVKIGKILIQRDESTSERVAKLFYSKLPDEISKSTVILLDPMLASGSSSKLAVHSLLKEGVKEENIIFVNIIAAPEGVEALLTAYPKITIVTSMIDDGLDSSKYIIPGIGDFGDIFFGT